MAVDRLRCPDPRQQVQVENQRVPSMCFH